jgi:hypothetical protein
MNKMKLRNLKHQQEGMPTDDSGREGRITKPKKPIKKDSGNRTDSSRHQKKEKETSKSSVKNMRLQDSPKPIRPTALPANMRMSTPAFLRSRKETGTMPTKIKMKRRYSAPSSPVPDEPIQSIGMIASTAEGPARPVPLHGSLPIPPVASSHSLLSIPRPPFMKRHTESLTDTEAVASPSVRLKTKRASLQADDSGASTPMRRQNVRRQTMAKLKINLPDHVTQHFAHGWPHAGSWQDALNGNYDEVKESSGASRRSSKDAKRQSSLPISPRAVVGPITPRIDHGSDSASAPATPPVRRYKTRRNRKYRQAIAPPTPSGLGFTAAEREESWKQGRVVEEGFDWGNGDGHGDRHNRITEEGDLTMDRTETTEKMGAQKATTTIKNKVERNDGLDWKQRLRRKLFLDARVTIWIRFANLAVVVCSLGELRD